jgi:organic radical activating enzyme
MKISEMFTSIQGEGMLAGVPMTFVRLSGCNMKCEYCDSKFARKFMQISPHMLARELTNAKRICWTGGEPLLQREELYKTIQLLPDIFHALETNGELLCEKDFEIFDHVTVSPKMRGDWERYLQKIDEVKVVTDLSVNKDLIPFATSLMPLTTFDTKRDSEIKRKIWSFCVHHFLRYSPRLQNEVWQGKRSH